MGVVRSRRADTLALVESLGDTLTVVGTGILAIAAILGGLRYLYEHMARWSVSWNNEDAETAGGVLTLTNDSKVPAHNVQVYVGTHLGRGAQDRGDVLAGGSIVMVDGLEPIRLLHCLEGLKDKRTPRGGRIVRVYWNQRGRIWFRRTIRLDLDPVVRRAQRN